MLEKQREDMESLPSLFKNQKTRKIVCEYMQICLCNSKISKYVSNGYDTKSLRSRERVRTPVTQGEGVRHPHTLEEVGLSRPIRSYVANVGSHAV